MTLREALEQRDEARREAHAFRCQRNAAWWENDALVAQVAALTKEIADRADTEASLTEQLLKSCEEHDTLAAQVATLRLAAQTMHDWCDDVRKDTVHPCDFMRPGYEPGDTIFRKLGEALALTPTDARARIEAMETVMRAAAILCDHFDAALDGREEAHGIHRRTKGCLAERRLRDALAHPAVRQEIGHLVAADSVARIEAMERVVRDARAMNAAMEEFLATREELEPSVVDVLARLVERLDDALAHPTLRDK